MKLKIVHRLSQKNKKEFTALVLDIGFKDLFVSFKYEDMLRLVPLTVDDLDNMKIGEEIEIANFVKAGK